MCVRVLLAANGDGRKSFVIGGTKIGASRLGKHQDG